MSDGQLHVWLHGMWAIVSTSECIELLAPEVLGDDYSVDVTPAPPNAIPQLVANSSYFLTGVTREPVAARFPRKEALVIDDLRVINRAGNVVRCSVYLPHPRAVEAVRKVNVQPERFFLGAYGKRSL